MSFLKSCCEFFFPEETPFGTLCVNCETLVPGTLQTPNLLKVCCENSNLVDETSGTVCHNCGYVIPKSLSLSLGKEFYKTRDKGQHGHVDVLLSGHKRNLGTCIQPTFKHKTLCRTFIQNSSDNQYQQNYLNKKNLELLLPNVPEKFILKTTDEFNSLNLYKEENEEKNSYKGNRKRGLQAVCLYFAYHFFGEFIQKQDICKQLGIDSSVFSNGRKLYLELKRKNGNLRNYTSIVGQDDPSTVCHSVCVTCDIHPKDESIILLCFTSILKYKICPRNTSRSILYSVVYYYLLETNNQDKIPFIIEHGHIAVSTMKKIHKLIKEYEQIVLWGMKKMFKEK